VKLTRIDRGRNEDIIYVSAQNVSHVTPAKEGCRVYVESGERSYEFCVTESAEHVEKQRLWELRSIHQTPDYRE
jgi:hypothetical protein